ncbi:MAG TPA: SDR family NAD(P)-dependent oxidoreductase [Solirubrobacterales bacterium]|nr:SDR family NAD(P)-dependent oxidoreductase [Solirubrobacterales bacterium]
MTRFSGKVALVTGASSGIGRAIALALAAEGARVAAVSRGAERLEGVVEEITAAGSEAAAFPADVAEMAEVERAMEALADRFGGLDLIAHAAGAMAPDRVVDELEEADWDRVLDTNAKSCFLLAKHGIPLMRARGGGSVVNISAPAGAVTARKISPYASSKAAVNMFTRSAAVEYGPEGIRFNAVVPGLIRTPMLEADLHSAGMDVDDIAGVAPIGRVIEPEEVAALVLYLLSDEASASTGSVHYVDGGWTAVVNHGEID